MREFMGVAKGLSDANRARILMVLRGGELCVCQIVALLNLAPSTVSKHLAILHQARLIESRKEGRWIFYSLPGKSAPSCVRGCLRWVESCLERDDQIVRDAKRLKEIWKMDIGKLCCLYHRGLKKG